MDRKLFNEFLKDEQFEKDVQLVKDNINDMLELDLMNQSKNGKTSATIELLRARAADRGYTNDKKMLLNTPDKHLKIIY